MQKNPLPRLLIALMLMPGIALAQHGGQSLNAPAIDLLHSLDGAQLARVQFRMEDSTRFNWHYVPPTQSPRDGLPLREMTARQQEKCMALLKLFLSEQGYERTKGIMSLEDILKVLEPDNPSRIPGNYFVAVYGDPSKDKVWAWKFTGHHIALNYTVVDGKAAFAPFFFGANPDIVKDGPRKGYQVLKEEEELGFQLVNGMDETQLKQAMIELKAYADIQTTNSPHASDLKTEGVPGTALRSEQLLLLQHLIESYLSNMPPMLAKARMKRIQEEDLRTVHFAWAGGRVAGEGHYYRIQGNSFLIEFDNTQNNANHIHSVWRDRREGDYGEDLIRAHYHEAHGN